MESLLELSAVCKEGSDSQGGFMQWEEKGQTDSKGEPRQS